MVIHESSFFIETQSDNPYFKGIAFIVASVFFALPLLFFCVYSFLYSKGLAYMTENQIFSVMCFYAAFLFLAIPLGVTGPNFKRLGHSEKITGKVIDYVTRGKRSNKSAGGKGLAPVIEYEYKGQIFQKSLPFMRKKEIKIGDTMEICIDRRNPEKTIVNQQKYTLFGVLLILSLVNPIIFLFFIIFLLGNAFQGATVFIPKQYREKITARYIDLLDNQQEYAPIVKYNYNGQNYKTQLASWSTTRPFVGATVTLRVNPKMPEKIASIKDLVLSIVVVCIFSIGTIIFTVIGIKGPSGSSMVEYDSSAGSSNPVGLIIWISFIVVFLLIGIFYCRWVKKNLNKQK